MCCAQNRKRFKLQVKDLKVDFLVEKPINYKNLKQMMQ